MARAALGWLGVVVALGGGCGSSGRVELVIDLPAEMALSPIDDRVARLTLMTQATGLSTQVENVDVAIPPMRGQTLAFGDVPIANGVLLDLQATSPSGRLLGFGHAGPLDVTSGDALSVSVKLRRPFAYVAGGASLWAFDATVEPGQPYARAVAMPAGPAAVATTPDGGEVVVVAEDALVLVSTSTHARVGGTAALEPGALDVAVSPDGRWAAVVHVAGISLVDLATLRGGDATAGFAAIDNPAAVAVGPGTAYVLTDAAQPTSCAAPSSIVPVPLAAAPVPGTPIVLASGARDLAVVTRGPRAGSLVVAEPCQNALVIAGPDGSGQNALLQVPNLTSVAVSDQRVWGVGWQGDESELFLVLSSVGFDGQAPTSLNLAPSQALAQSNDLTEPGQVTEDRLGADALDPFELVILPGARHAALLLHGQFHADQVIRTVTIGDTTVNQVILPRIDMETFEYVLIDVTAGAAAQRLRTRCAIDWQHDVAVIDDWSCASTPGQDVASETFTPLHQAVLYGGD
jgi:hypothetical protein